jgi:hypothetical protein
MDIENAIVILTRAVDVLQTDVIALRKLLAAHRAAIREISAIDSDLWENVRNILSDD